MNANGISVFYGANAPKAGIAEVRPPVGSWVATARFAITRPLLLLDLSALDDARETGSIFDRGFARRLELAAFLRTLSQRMTRAIMPDDEAFDYLGTQATADFLATENDPPLDGIIFPSVQAAHRALNFVLFHKASSVEPVELPAGTTVDASAGFDTEDGWEIDYRVTEAMPPGKQSLEGALAWPGSDFFEILANSIEPETQDAYSGGVPTLLIDLESVRVHVISSVEIGTDEHSARRT